MCLLVEGLYQLEVTLSSYSNPTGRCGGCGPSQGCCDDHGDTTCGGLEHCDTYFIYCLRTIGSTGRCYFGNMTSDVSIDNSHTDFSSRSMVFGLDNPLILQGLTSNYSVYTINVIEHADGMHIVQH